MAALTLLSGCASSPATARFTQELAPTSRVASADTVKATVAAQSNLDVLEVERTRLSQRIEERISAKKAANQHNPAREVLVEVNLTRYDKGNAFARAMLAGLGQIHIEGHVSLWQLPEHTALGGFDIKKTFAWGGIYGASTTIEDIERAFADGIASAVTGTEEDAK
jgi:hypothetical protein